MRNYRIITALIAPLLPLWLLWRRWRGKEDVRRMGERLGVPSRPRPAGTLLWLHAASVGEANSILLLIKKLRAQFAQVNVLLTTGTVTSAKLMQSRLPKEVIHQYAPVDTPQATERFIRHWKPDLAFWVESEFWPNMVFTADKYQCFMGVINARLSERSFKRWQKYPTMMQRMLSCFNVIFAQSAEDAKRLQALGAKEAFCLGNLKYDAAFLPCDEAELLRLKNAVGARPVWLAASTHPGEEAMAAEAHAALLQKHPEMLLVITPRHPNRGEAIAAEMKKRWRVAQRARKEAITADAQIYIADTLGELGLFYRLSEMVFMGGSLVPHGGQNPLEPARLACAILTGPHTHNFADIYRELERANGCLGVKNAAHLASQVELLLANPPTLNTLQTNARQWVESQGGATDRVLDTLAPLFSVGKKAA